MNFSRFAFVALILLAVAGAFAAKHKDLDWKTGTLTATAETSQQIGALTHSNASATAWGGPNFASANANGFSHSRTYTPLGGDTLSMGGTTILS
jgi:hypothetical protein